MSDRLKCDLRNAYSGEGRVWMKRKEYGRGIDAFRKAILYNTDRKNEIQFRQQIAYGLLKLGAIQEGQEQLEALQEIGTYEAHEILFSSRLHVVLSQLVAPEQQAEEIDKGISAFQQSMVMNCSCARDLIKDEDFLPIANHPAIKKRLAQ